MNVGEAEIERETTDGEAETERETNLAEASEVSDSLSSDLCLTRKADWKIGDVLLGTKCLGVVSGWTIFSWLEVTTGSS